MIGRAGRPGFDTTAVAVVMVTEEKKMFYKRFLYSPFPVESCLDRRINENLNAEIAGGTIASREDALGYLEWTFFARRVKRNPTFYGAKSTSEDDVSAFLDAFVGRTLDGLADMECVGLDDETSLVESTSLGDAAAQFYLCCSTPKQFRFGVEETCRIVKGEDLCATPQQQHELVVPPAEDEASIAWILYAICSSHEFDEVPVRHNEEFLNEELSRNLMWGPDTSKLVSGSRGYHGIEVFEDPHTKSFLMVQAYLEHAKLPISDYVNDTKSVIENMPRLLSAFAYVGAAETNTPGIFDVLSQCSRTRQVLEVRARVSDSPLLQLPGVTASSLEKQPGMSLSLYDLRNMAENQSLPLLRKLLKNKPSKVVESAIETLGSLPCIKIATSQLTLKGSLGKLELKLDVSSRNTRKRKSSRNDTSSPSLTLLVGTQNSRYLLCQDSARLPECGTISRSLSFDWMKAKNDGDSVLLRLLIEEIRGLDTELEIKLAER